jgi:GTP cyclohydrolase II
MAHKAERGLFELRQGRALYVTDPGSSALVAAVEGLTEERLEQLREIGSDLRVVVTHHRGHAMGLANGGPARHLSIALAADATPESINRIATAMRPAGQVAARPATGTEAAGLALARIGQLIPAVVSVTPDTMRLARLLGWLSDDTVLDVSGTEIESVVSKTGIEVTHVAEANVPLEDAETAQFVFFREGNGFVQHVAILIGEREQWPDPVPVRLHSACLTGDIFGSLRCDCGEQLHGCLRYFAEQGGGVLVYLAQEGRGIGLGNKLRAYALQQEGLDTVDADGALGFGADERRYDAAVAILEHLGVDRVELLTNNPDKLRAVEEAGIEVVSRRPLHGRLNPHNARYVHAKVHRSGHWLMDMINQGIAGD